MVVCKEYEARISALIDDELTIDERIEVLEHLDRCPACRSYWEDLLAMRDVLREQESAPAGFADAVMARVHVTEQEKTLEKKVLRFPQWRRYAALAACCAVVLVGIWSMDLMPGTENNMDMTALNGCAAPERSTQGDAMTGPVWDAGADECEETPEVDYGVSDDGSAASYDAPEAPDGLPESDAESDSIKAFAQNGDFTAAVVTASGIAEEWVEDNLNEAWTGGTVYSLNEQQYNELRGLLEDAGEEFTEIMGEKNGDEYRLLAE